MTGRILSRKIVFFGLGVVVLGLAAAASASKAAKTAQKKAAVAKPALKAAPLKPTTAKTTTAKPTTAKPTTAKTTAAKPTTAKTTAAKTAPVKTASKTGSPGGSAGWVYLKPGGSLPQVVAPRAVEAPRHVVVKDPRNGFQMTVPPTTYSIATISPDGKVHYDCEPQAAAKAGPQTDSKAGAVPDAVPHGHS